MGQPAWFVKAALDGRYSGRHARRLEEWFLGSPEGEARIEHIAKEIARYEEEESEKTMHVDPNALYSLAELAQELDVSKRTLQRLVKSGTLPARRLGRRVLVRGADLLDGLPEVEVARVQRGRK
jgi:excisionase family DNA binding protein